jgi:insulysin
MSSRSSKSILMCVGRCATVTFLLTILGTPAIASPITSSPVDDRQYDYVELSNGLKVVLVSDPTAEVAAASLDVNIGSGDDPADRAGLAHFLEHMLFLGTEKFPDPGEYRAFINANGGSQNAYTAHENTNYYFDIEAGALEGALERFSQFFTSPLFDARYVKRERHAVHAEYMTRLKSDAQRTYEVLKESVNPGHPFSQFSVGSNESLADRPGEAVRDRLIKFYSKHYRTGNMSLAIAGRQSIDVLRDLAVKHFSNIPTGGPTYAKMRPPLMGPDEVPVRLNIVPFKDRRALNLRFPISSHRDQYKSKPVTYVAHMLGHEGKGSLLSLLRAKGLANSLSAGGGLSFRYNETFDVSIGLTRSGLERVDEIVALVFEYIGLIREAGPEQVRFDELAQLARTNFRFMERRDTSALTRSLASNVHIYPSVDILRGAVAFDDFDPVPIRKLFARLVPENLMLTVTAVGLETDRHSYHFKAPYSRTSIPPSTLATWSGARTTAELALPEPNPFIATRLDMVDAKEGVRLPAEIFKEPGFALWHAADVTFARPTASFYVSIRSPNANDTPRHAVLTRLFVAMINEMLVKPLYPASVAGLGLSVYPHLRGLSMRVHGYSDKHALLVRQAVDAMRSPVFELGTFERVREALTRGWANRALDDPYSQAMATLHNYLLDPHWTPAQLLGASEDIKLADLQAFVDKLFESIDVVALSHGNVKATTALEIAEQVRSTLLKGRRTAEVARARVVRLNEGDATSVQIAVNHNDVAVARYYQGRTRQPRERAAVSMLAHLVSSPFYTQLRTEEQLGYVVFASAMPVIQVPGLLFAVQSPNARPDAIEARMDAFLLSAAKRFADLDPAEFGRQREALLTRLLERDSSLRERTNRYWQEMDRPGANLDGREQLAQALRSLTVRDMAEIFTAMFVDGSRRVSVQAVAGTPQENRAETDRTKFQDARTRFKD